MCMLVTATTSDRRRIGDGSATVVIVMSAVGTLGDAVVARAIAHPDQDLRSTRFRRASRALMLVTMMNIAHVGMRVLERVVVMRMAVGRRWIPAG